MNPSICPGKTTVSRADLLRVLAADGEQALDSMAFALGYERKPVKGFELGGLSLGIKFGDTPASPTPEIEQEIPAARFFRVTERIPKPPAEGENPHKPPDWLQDAELLTHDERPDPASVRLPARLPLTRWARLWPFLRWALGRDGPSRQLDIPRLLRQIGKGEVPRCLPWRNRHQWSVRLCVLLDYNRQVLPFREDFNALCRLLEAWHGRLGLDIRILQGEPGRRTCYRQPGDDSLRRWRMPEAGSPLLILSDLGLLDAADTVRAWRLFGQQLRAAGCRPVVLCPVPAHRHEPGVQALFSLHEWDRHSRFQRGAARPARLQPPAEGAETLLTLAAPAIFVESALLRALRHLLPAGEADVAAEAQVWVHADILASNQGCCLANPAAMDKYQRQFQALPPDLRSRAVALIRAHHAGLPASVRHAELDVCDRLAPGYLDEPVREEIRRWKRDIVKTAGQSTSAALREWQGRHVDRHPPASAALWRHNDELAALWALAQREKLARREAVELLPQVSAEQVRYFLEGTHLPRPDSRILSQRGQQLLLQAGGAADIGSFFAEIALVGGVFVRQEEPPPGTPLAKGETKDGRLGCVRQYVAAAEEAAFVAELTQDTWLVELETSAEILRIESLVRPDWAVAIGRDRSGLFAEAYWLGIRHRLVWQAPGPGQRGFWQGAGPLGVDAYGLYADLKLKGVVQRFRWIEPGRFMMGSPETEPERYGDETQHEVTLTQGYWLADSACTQALWRAVMGNNPSRFHDDLSNPVENVSWDDAQAFIQALNGLAPGLDARLPTEAEWEHACRADTATPFSFGANITPEQVNYNGNHPYAGGKQGLYREKTVPVKSLPPNAWGLHEMHGNVWEWCEDWFGGYDAGPQTDPVGPPEGSGRVLRGGSWVRNGWYVRSADRSWDGPDDRDDDIGFRLALGLTAGPGRQAAEPPSVWPARIAASGARRRSGRAGEETGEAAPTDGGTIGWLDRFTSRWRKK